MKKTKAKKKKATSLSKRLKAALRENASLIRQIESSRKQHADAIRINQHNAGGHHAAEVAFLRLNRETEELRNQNKLLRSQEIKRLELLPPVPKLTPHPQIDPVGYAALAKEDDTRKPLPALHIPTRIRVDQPALQ